jgi:transposase
MRIRLNTETRQSLTVRLGQAYASGSLRLVKRIHVLLQISQDSSVIEVAELFGLGEQTVRDHVKAFLLKGLQSLIYKRPSGRPPKLNKTQRKELAELVKAGPEAAGYDSGCWTAVMLQDLIYQRFGIEYHPHYICVLLDNMGFSFQKARFISDHLNEVARHQWDTQTWPEILRLAKKRRAMILFGDEASFAQWGSLSYTWAPKGEQPTVKTTGKRKAYKVFGLIDYFSGKLFYKGHTGRFNSESYSAFLSEVLSKTSKHLVLIQDGARYHTSKDMQLFFSLRTSRLTVFQLPSYSPDFNPIEFLWKKMKKRATHLRYFPEFDLLVQKVEEALLYFAETPSEIKALTGHYCETLGTMAKAS